MQFAVILIWPGMFESRQHGVVMNGTDSGIDSSRVYSVGCSGVRVSGKIHDATSTNAEATKTGLSKSHLYAVCCHRWKPTHPRGWQLLCDVKSHS